MEYQTSLVSLSQKLSIGHSIYNGVFSTPSKFTVPSFSSRLEDYCEIFAGSDASIPVLDVPKLNERKASVDVRRSQLDYSDVFGGFADSDFAAPYEELFAEKKKDNFENGIRRDLQDLEQLVRLATAEMPENIWPDSLKLYLHPIFGRYVFNRNTRIDLVSFLKDGPFDFSE